MNKVNLMNEWWKISTKLPSYNILYNICQRKSVEMSKEDIEQYEILRDKLTYISDKIEKSESEKMGDSIEKQIVELVKKPTTGE